MGLAASQGRLLLLTARKSDLELQAQQISQDRLLLSIQQETIAQDYSDAVNNQIYQIKPSGETEYTALSVAALNQHFGSGNYRIRDTRTGKPVTLSSVDASDGSSDTPDSLMQQNILNGFWIIETADLANGNSNSFTQMSLSGNSNFRQTYYTEDDAAAKARYDAAMARVQRLDKQLELKLNQVETQHKAVETEIESVDKVISNNIESSFKYFS